MRCGILLIVIALFTPIFYGCGSNPTGVYYPPQTVVNTIGIKKVPLTATGITDYKMFFSFEKEPEREKRYKRLGKGKKILTFSFGYFTEADYLGRKYYLYDDSDSLKITAADSKKNGGTIYSTAAHYADSRLSAAFERERFSGCSVGTIHPE